MTQQLGPLLVIALMLVAGACTSDEAERGPIQAAASPSPSEEPAPIKCDKGPIPHERKDVKNIAFARGDGPVFVGLGTAGVVRYTVDAREHEGWYYNKTLWAISPRYQGEVTISGEQLDGPEELRFNPAAGFPGEKLSQLEFESSDAAEWRYGPSDTLIRADGCYAFRIEGEGFVEWVTFIARS
jgi:hypothetical protein